MKLRHLGGSCNARRLTADSRRRVLDAGRRRRRRRRARGTVHRALERERALRDARAAARSRRFAASSRRTRRSCAASRRAATATTRCGRRATSSLLAYQRFGEAADRRTAVRLLNQLKTAVSVELAARIARRDRRGVRRRSAGRRPRLAKPPRAATPVRHGRRLSRRRRQPCRRRPLLHPRPTAADDASPRYRPTRPPACRRTGRGDPRHHAYAASGRDARQHRDGRRDYVSARSGSDNPKRVFFDLKNARPVTILLDATLKYPRRDRCRDPARTPSAEHDPGRHGHERRRDATACSRCTTRIEW